MKRNITLLLTALLSVVLFYSVTTLAQGEKHERHPKIRHAIVALEAAQAELKNAAHDFGGHREAALKECDAAIVQLKLALDHDKK
jgi:hypothetical protein